MSNKETPYLKLVRTPPSEKPEEDSSFEELKGLSLSERMYWRGIEPKTVVLALTSLSIVCATAILLLLAAAQSLIN